MSNLHRTNSNFSFQERDKINQNWVTLENSLFSLQRQINVLAGGAEMDELLQTVETTKNNLTSLQQQVATHLEQNNTSAHKIDNIVGLRDALTKLADVTNVIVDRNLVAWTNPTSNDVISIEAYISTVNLASWTREQCISNAIKIVDANATTATFSYTLNTRYYIKIFVKYSVFGVFKFSDGVTISTIVNTEHMYKDGNEYASLTGGWSVTSFRGNNYTTNMSIDKSNQKITLSCLNAAGVAGIYQLTHNTAINITNVKSITMKAHSTLATDKVSVAVSTTKFSGDYGNSAAFQALSSITGGDNDSSVTLNVNALSGNVYVYMIIENTHADGAIQANGIFNEVTLNY